MKMNRHDKIEEFLDYGGNQLFSTLMGSDMQRSVGTDRLIELLQAYSDSCRRIKGRSAAYRFMLKKAAKLGWLGKGSGDLKSHRLTQADRAYIMKKLDEYISSGGRNMRLTKKAAGIAAAVMAMGLFAFAMVRYVKSEEYQQRLTNYFIKIENIERNADEIVFDISTTEGMSFIYMEHMPRLYYMTDDGETEITVLPENDIHDIVTETVKGKHYSQDPRSIYTSVPQELWLTSYDYGQRFQPGTYRVVFDFYYYNEKEEKEHLAQVTKEVEVE